jgi:hypothetical protein
LLNFGVGEGNETEILVNVIFAFYYFIINITCSD